MASSEIVVPGEDLERGTVRGRQVVEAVNKIEESFVSVDNQAADSLVAQ
jgi:hypothetical protein